jgi:TRAP-type C4-dicarboxylate transport system permease small subunit
MVVVAPRKLDKSLEGLLMGVLLIGISFIILLQIVMRLLKMSLPWPEELARYFYVWSVFLSLSYSIHTGLNLRVDLLINFLPNKLHTSMNFLLQFVDTLFFTTLFYHSLRVIIAVKTSNQTSPALEIPMYIVYLIVPVGFFLATLRAAQQMYFILKGEHLSVDVLPDA